MSYNCSEEKNYKHIRTFAHSHNHTFEMTIAWWHYSDIDHIAMMMTMTLPKLLGKCPTSIFAAAAAHYFVVFVFVTCEKKPIEVRSSSLELIINSLQSLDYRVNPSRYQLLGNYTDFGEWKAKAILLYLNHSSVNGEITIVNSLNWTKFFPLRPKWNRF